MVDLFSPKGRTAGDIASDRIAALGIPSSDLTPAVTIAVTALLEKLERTDRELNQARETLQEMESLVDVDCLAPIPNRRAFQRRMGWAISMNRRYGHPSSVLFFDLNNLKQINDTYGHAAGDAVIKHVAQRLKSAIRESDFLARLGGDEFAVILYYVGQEAAETKANDMARSVSQSPFFWNGRALELSVAVGAYAIRPGDDAESAVSAADAAMYVNKRRMKELLAQVQA
jgi:diguanylate cyclase (GGDEF)-like protein